MDLDAPPGPGPLPGPWWARPAGEAVRPRLGSRGHGSEGWEPVTVPGHWRSVRAFAGSDGPLLYRTTFETAADALDPGTRSWLVLDGVFYTSDVWLDDTYVGDTEGYFFPHAFEITDTVRARREHVLEVEVVCAPPHDRTRKRNLTGVFQHWDLIDRDWNPGGIWRPVRVEHSGPVRIRHLRVLCKDAREAAATVFVRAVVDASLPETATLRTTVRDEHDREVAELTSERPLASGENRLEWTLTVPNPRRWWPWSLGDQPRYRVDVEVVTPDGPSDHRRRWVGLREVSLRNWIFTVNGERLFLKGANQGPTVTALAEASADDFARDVRLAREANLDLLRVHGHISRHELYEAADAEGLLLWQDLPLQWGYGRGVRAQARRQAREAVDLLAHHPSVVLWCGHNEPIAVDPGPDTLTTPRRRARLVARAAVGQLLPTWNKSVLDHAIAAALEKADGSRPVVAHSGVWPHVPQLDGTDSHLYFGWYHGDERDFPRLLRWWPRLARFVGEFGAQAVPVDAGFLEPARWPDLDWERAARRHSLQRPFFDRHVPPAAFATFEAWQEATQAYQAELIRHHVVALRLRKYRPTGGFAQFCFADGHPSVTWSVLGHDRRPKRGYDALRAACAPVIVVATRLPAVLRAGGRLGLEVHVVSDERITRSDMVASLHLDWRTDGRAPPQTWTWTGDVAPDACARVGRVDATVPADAERLVLRVALTGADGQVVATHRDEAPVRT